MPVGRLGSEINPCTRIWSERTGHLVDTTPLARFRSEGHAMIIPSRRTCGLGAAPLVALLLAAGPTPSREEIARGREIFHREWLPDDARSHQGDGVGPVYNETSCVACHNLGAPGGAGPASKNVDILSAFEV